MSDTPRLDAVANRYPSSQKVRHEIYHDLIALARQLERENKTLRAALDKAYYELNAIHARDGVPYTADGWKSSVTQEYFTSVVEEARAALKATEAP